MLRALLAGLFALVFSAAWAAPVATSIGSNAASSASTNSISGVTTPAGALIVVCVSENSNVAPGGSVSDGTNTYTALVGASNAAVTANGYGRMFYAFNATAITSGTITYTAGLFPSVTSTSISAFYVTGIQTLSDPSEASNSATGTSTTPSVTSGTPAGAADFFVGCVSTHGASSNTFTQDSTNAAWATPPVRVGSGGGSGPTIAGGSVQGAGTSALTYAPTVTSVAWAAMIGAFKVASAAPPATHIFGALGVGN